MVNCFYYEKSLENDTITIFDKTRAGKHDARVRLSTHANTLVNCFYYDKSQFVDFKLDWQHFARGLLSLTLTP